MTKIKKYVAHIDDELAGAKEYAERALEYKAAGDQERYARYKAMANDELTHAAIVHDFAVQDIEKLKSVYPDIPSKMTEAWDASHRDFVERTVWIKQMLAM